MAESGPSNRRRILLVGPASLSEIEQECVEYADHGYDVSINVGALEEGDRAASRSLIARFPSTRKVDFDVDCEQAFIEEFLAGEMGYDAVVIPFPCRCVTSAALSRILAINRILRHPLSIVGIPNDSMKHVRAREEHRASLAFFTTSGIHRYAVAEYVMCQLMVHCRLERWVRNAPDRPRLWRDEHLVAVRTTRHLRGQTLGVLGASGRDGTAVTESALALGMRVVCHRPSRQEDIRKLEEMGAEVFQNLEEVFRRASCLALHTRVELTGEKSTRGIIGREQIAAMNPGTIIVNTAGADLFDASALFDELDAPPARRRIAQLVLDMPFVDTDGTWDLERDDNRRLTGHSHVLLTPRVSGYTLGTRLQACYEIAGMIKDRLDGRQRR